MHVRGNVEIWYSGRDQTGRSWQSAMPSRLVSQHHSSIFRILDVLHQNLLLSIEFLKIREKSSPYIVKRKLLILHPKGPKLVLVIPKIHIPPSVPIYFWRSRRIWSPFSKLKRSRLVGCARKHLGFFYLDRLKLECFRVTIRQPTLLISIHFILRPTIVWLEWIENFIPNNLIWLVRQPKSSELQIRSKKF